MHRGLYRYTRLPFGIASAPAQFQKIMDGTLQGVPKTMCYILVTGSEDSEHLRNLEEVLSRLQAHGVRMKRNKCFFLQPSVEYLGHLVDAVGLRATPSKVDAILKDIPSMFDPFWRLLITTGSPSWVSHSFEAPQRPLEQGSPMELDTSLYVLKLSSL